MTVDSIEVPQADRLLQAVSNCFLCSREGVVRYRNLRDYTFGGSGSWDYRYCQECQLLWLAERPLPADIGKYYVTYYTHSRREGGSWKQNLKQALISRILGSDALCPGRRWRLAAKLLGRLAPFAESARMASMMLAGRAPGKLLDVGCGNGEFLAMMQQAGWDVSAVEPDSTAAQVSSKRLGITVPTVDLEGASFPSKNFDAITLSHVLEHVYDPIEVLRECRRILKPGGHVVIVTPNIGSLGHAQFEGNWRGLEPPRHLHLFSIISLRECALKAGLVVKLLRSSARMARGIWLESQAITRKKNGGRGSTAAWRAFPFQVYEEIFRGADKEWGEELVLVATPDLRA